MDNLLRSPLNWAYYYQGKNMEELRQSLLYTSLELETTRIAAQDEISRREEQLTHLKDLLDRAIRERDDAEDKCQRLLFDKLLLQHQQQQQQQQTHHQQTTLLSGISSIEDEPRRGGDSSTGISSSDCEESIVSSPVNVMDSISLPPPPPPPQPPQTLQLTPEKPLPEKGKFLQAVMKAGPLLQTLLLAGPLPQWRHPPPPLESFEIPPVAIPSPTLPLPLHLLHQPDSPIGIHGEYHQSCGTLINKRKRTLVGCEGSDSSINSKYQRVLLH